MMPWPAGRDEPMVGVARAVGAAAVVVEVDLGVLGPHVVSRIAKTSRKSFASMLLVSEEVFPALVTRPCSGVCWTGFCHWLHDLLCGSHNRGDGDTRWPRRFSSRRRFDDVSVLPGHGHSACAGSHGNGQRPAGAVPPGATDSMDGAGKQHSDYRLRSPVDYRQLYGLDRIGLAANTSRPSQVSCPGRVRKGLYGRESLQYKVQDAWDTNILLNS